MKIKLSKKKESSKEVIDPKPQEEVPTKLVELHLPSHLPDVLERIVYAYKLIGNKWCTSIELSLEAMVMGFNPDGLDDLNAVRTLWYLGYLDVKEPGREILPVKRYRLSKKAMSLVGVSASQDLEDGDLECTACEGMGVDDDGEVCPKCEGTGRVTAARKKTATKRSTVSPPEKTWSEAIREISGSSNECGQCEGMGVDDNGELCKKCKGTGQAPADTPSDRKPAVATGSKSTTKIVLPKKKTFSFKKG